MSTEPRCVYCSRAPDIRSAGQLRDEFAAQNARIVELTEALRPLAGFHIADGARDDDTVFVYGQITISAGDIRRAVKLVGGMS